MPWYGWLCLIVGWLAVKCILVYPFLRISADASDRAERAYDAWIDERTEDDE